MSDQNQKPPIPAEIQHILDNIEKINTEEFKEAYEYFQNSEPGDQMDCLHMEAAAIGDTKKIFENMWQHGSISKHPCYHSLLIGAIEYAVRLEKNKKGPTP